MCLIWCTFYFLFLKLEIFLYKNIIFSTKNINLSYIFLKLFSKILKFSHHTFSTSLLQQSSVMCFPAVESTFIPEIFEKKTAYTTAWFHSHYYQYVCNAKMVICEEICVKLDPFCWSTFKTELWIVLSSTLSQT